MADTKLTTPSVLAFERKLDPSDATFYAGKWEDRAQSDAWPPVTIQTKAVRGTISNRLKEKDQDPAKLDAAIENPNLQTVDVAALPTQADTLKVQFTLRVLPGLGRATACNEIAYQEKLQSIVNQYIGEQKFTELGRRYATNLANGRFLWRNRVGAETIEILIERMGNGTSAQSWTFDALAFNTRTLDTLPAGTEPKLHELGTLIAQGLAGQEHVLLRITAYVRQGQAQEVFPSQELVLDRDNAGKSKTLYHVNGTAAIHSQKIGNAIRTIDTWYGEAQTYGPIAVEPYGSVTTLSKAFRGKGKSFYSIFDDWMLKDKTPTAEDQHYVIAVLVRGGVFGA